MIEVNYHEGVHFVVLQERTREVKPPAKLPAFRLREDSMTRSRSQLASTKEDGKSTEGCSVSTKLTNEEEDSQGGPGTAL